MDEKNQEKSKTISEDCSEKKVYETPACKKYQPLEIMSKWEDKSSELVF